MVTKLQYLTYKIKRRPFFNYTIILALFYLIPNNYKANAAPPAEWDYSLGSKEKFSKPIYTPLKKIESEVLYYPGTGGEKPAVQSPLGKDYYTYILPQDVFGLKTLEVEITEEKALEKIKAKELAKEIEEAIPIIMQAALKKKKEQGLEQSQKYLLRVKSRPKAPGAGSARSKNQVNTEKEKTKETPQKEKIPSESETDILVNVIFGQGKVIIKIPPLKDPQEQKRLLKELERLAQIMVRQKELLTIEQVAQ